MDNVTAMFSDEEKANKNEIVINCNDASDAKPELLIHHALARWQRVHIFGAENT